MKTNRLTNGSYLEAVLEHLKSTEKLSYTILMDLSDLDTFGLFRFKEVWSLLNAKRRRKVITILNELTSDNPCFNFDAIYKYAISDNEAEVRRGAIEGLWENEDSHLIKSLIDILKNDSATMVRIAAVKTLGRFTMLGEQGKITKDQHQAICQVILKLFFNRSEPDELRRRALEAVAPYTSQITSTAITTAYSDDNPKMKASAVYAMGQNLDPRWLKTILKELSSPIASIRYEAVTAAGEFGAKEATEIVMKLTSDKDIEIGFAAIRALGKIGGAKVKRRLVSILNGNDSAAAEVAEEALSELSISEELIHLRLE